MGQAWCKEKSAKAQDSKSPLDRVFVRCAHKIYPGLKEDGSCLGAGTAQRVTSSTPRKQLQRGQSIDSVDRPFHPSEWVDVNLEVACEPLDSALFDAANQRSSSYLSRLNGVNSAIVAPIPPPRRRRRRRAKNSNDVNGPQFDASRSTESIDELDKTRDSDDEFVTLERSLEKSSLEILHTLPTRPKKNRSTTSLPQLPEEEQEEEAKRPPRHMKTTSLPRDASLFALPQPQIPERLFNTDQRIDEAAGDNSIFKIDQAENVKTSTPVKAQPHADVQDASSSFNLHDAFHSSDDQSRKSHDSSSQQQRQQTSASDMGYESRSSYLFAEHSNDDQEEQLSSGILGDALVEPSIELPDDEVIIVVVQRNLSNESLPSEMLIEEMDDDEDEIDNENKANIINEENSQISITQRGEFARQSNAEVNFKMPPPSPELKSIVENGMPVEQLDVSINDYMDAKEKTPEAQIIPIKRDRDIIDEEINNSTRLIDFHHQRDRRNPFNDEPDPIDSPPEKPNRIHQRSSLIEESAIEASLIVPTPPRRRHRNHHHRRSSSSFDDHHRHDDRLI